MLDDIRLRQILFNMIGNAVKFTHSGTVTLSVGASECKENKKIDLNIIVEDTGIGIPEEQLQFIFGSFEQKKGQRQEEYGGTGLGLAITKRLVEMMGGEIQVKSKVGEGSSFHVVLKNITVGSVDDITTELPALDTNSIIFNEATILIADDIETNRDLVKGYLEEYSLHFLEAANGQEVIDLLAENPYPELIIMDLKMPVLDGYEATLMIKKNAQYSSIPVLALTASVMKNFDQKTEFLYDGFLKKPVTKAELVTELTRFLKYTFVYSKDKEPVGEIEHKMYPENKISELIDKLEEKTAVWEKLSTALIMDEIEDFANQIHTLGKQYHAPWLSEWASSLKEQAEVFQIETMKKTLERFPELISQMHS